MTSSPSIDVIPQVTIAKIERFNTMVEKLVAAPTAEHASARIKVVYRAGAELSRHSDSLVTKMERGQRWLDKPENISHQSYREREDQWLAWLAEYEAIQDVLIAAKGMA